MCKARLAAADSAAAPSLHVLSFMSLRQYSTDGRPFTFATGPLTKWTFFLEVLPMPSAFFAGLVVLSVISLVMKFNDE